MRIRLLALALAVGVMGSGAPVITQEVAARSLLESLFPRAAQRRRERIERRRRQVQARRDAERARRKARSRSKTGAAPKKRAAQKQKARQRVAVAPIISPPTFKRYVAPAQDPIDFRKLSQLLVRKGLERQIARDRALDVAGRDHVGPGAFAATTFAAGVDMFAHAHTLASLDVRAEDALGRAVRSHYATAPRFLWIDSQGLVSKDAIRVLAVLQDAKAHGLDPEEYAVPPFAPTQVALTGIDVADGEYMRGLFEFEMSMTVAALRYLRDARHGRIRADGLSGYHDFSRNKVDWSKLTEALRSTRDAARLLKDAHPKHTAYASMREELSELRKAGSSPDLVRIAARTFMRPGASSAEVANIVRGVKRKGSADLLERHAGTITDYDGSEDYSEAIVAMVRDFQSEQGLTPDGIIGRRTIAKLVDPDPQVQIGKLELAIERLRWHPDEFGRRHVFINQPAYRASYMVDGSESLGMNVVVGKPANQTNFFHDEIEYVEFNPYWGLPRSILVNEYLPKLRQNASYLDQRGYEVTNGRGRKVASASVDWWSVGDNPPYDVRQLPGPKNALGELKIMFPNKHSIYMHDTPSKSLFGREKRAFSHGCVRLEDPRAMAAAVLATDIGTVAERIARGRNNALKLKNKVPVYVAYFTAWPDENGEIQFYEDIYGRDRALRTAMEKTSEARVRDERI